MTEKEFKTALSKGIKEISEAISSDMEPIKKDVLIKMTNKVYDLIIESGLSLKWEPIENTFKKILFGEIAFYKLNVLNLVNAFRLEINGNDILGPGERYEKGVRMKYNKVIPPGTEPCPSSLHRWSDTQMKWIYGN